MLLDRLIGEVSGCDDMREVAVVLATNFVAFGEMNLEKAAVLSSELVKRIQAFDDAGTFSPATPDACG